LSADNTHLVLFEDGCQGEDVAHVIVDDQHLFSRQGFVGKVEILEHAAMIVREPDGVAVEQ
jgi:hypothetical protein